MNSTSRVRTWLRRLFLGGLALIVLLSIGLVSRCLYAFRDRHPGYTLRLDRKEAPAGPQNSAPLRAGFGRVKINPDLSRPVWLAGFSQHRAATNIHDDLWSIACVLDDGRSRIGLVALDAIGLFHDDVITVRERLSSDWKLDYTVVCATHNHSTPDLMGLWGPDYLHTGVDPVYREQVIAAAVAALGQAVAALQPARVAFHEIPTRPDNLVADTRKPIVFDSDLRVMHFTRADSPVTLGTIVNWGNHPETVWGRNQEITSDYCGYLREALEKGLQVDGNLVVRGLGGTHLFFNGAVGGLMSTTPSVTVHDPYLNKDFKPPTHEKAQALGRQLLSRILPALTNNPSGGATQAPLRIHARTFELPLDNFAFLAAPAIGLMDRGHTRWKRLRTETALIRFGDASIACIPGEIYPEIVNGGIERAPGGDFDIDPVEVPPLRALMPGRVKFVFGLANDEIGYIIPKSEWDRKAPFLYGAKHGVYGEINSVGPETAPAIHAAFRELCKDNP